VDGSLYYQHLEVGEKIKFEPLKLASMMARRLLSSIQLSSLW
jgi:hypothetical protein